MHDGRFQTLDEVLSHYSEHVELSSTLSPSIKGVSNEKGGKKLHLSLDEKKDIIAFLQMLTDSNFITDERFSNPHHTSEKKPNH